MSNGSDGPLRKWQRAITMNCLRKGFIWDPKEVDTMLLRIHSEVTEASEAARDNNHKEVAAELADIFIRLANTAEVLGVDLDVEVAKKHRKNLARAPMHGRARK